MQKKFMTMYIMEAKTNTCLDFKKVLHQSKYIFQLYIPRAFSSPLACPRLAGDMGTPGVVQLAPLLKVVMLTHSDLDPFVHLALCLLGCTSTMLSELRSELIEMGIIGKESAICITHSGGVFQPQY